MVIRTGKLRVGVIGAGHFAEACHIPGIQSHGDAQVVALCARRYEQARALADKFSVPDVCLNYRELCVRTDIDAVTIATPNSEHAEQAIAALQAGKHVFCEKPLGMTVGQCQHMLTAAEESGKVHQVGFTYRYLYGVQELKRRIGDGQIGDPYFVRVQYDGWEGLQPTWKVGWREKSALAGGGVLFDVGSHLFDVCQFVLGPIEAITGFTHHIPRRRVDDRTNLQTDVETDDTAAAWFRHECGARGQWFISRATPPQPNDRWLEVIGPKGTLRASLSRGSVDTLQVCHPWLSDWETVPLSELAYDKRPHALTRMIRSFVDACLLGKPNGDIDASFRDGLAAQRGLHAVSAASDQLAVVKPPERREEAAAGRAECFSESGHHDY